MFSRGVKYQRVYTAGRTLVDLFTLVQKIQCPIKMSSWEDTIICLPVQQEQNSCTIHPTDNPWKYLPHLEACAMEEGELRDGLSDQSRIPSSALQGYCHVDWDCLFSAELEAHCLWEGVVELRWYCHSIISVKKKEKKSNVKLIF